MPVVENRKYQVAGFTIDTALFRVSDGAGPVPVEPKVFNLLVYLIRNRDRVLAREELFQAIWEGREVSDATLSNHIKSARRALGDNGELQGTIQTIRGRGYQFIAPVTELPTGASQEPAQPPVAAAAPQRKPSPAWRLPLAIAVLLAALLFMGWRALSTGPGETSLSGRPEVLVVPFDVSGENADALRLVADDITREVIRNLQKISGLRVFPRDTAFTFKGDKSRDHIRRRLPNARFVLDGVVSVGADDTVRLTAGLEDLESGLLTWDRDFRGRIAGTDSSELPAGIAEAVAGSLKVAILKDEQRALGEVPVRNFKAWRPYVEGWHQMELFTHESLQRAIVLFDKAIELDPEFFAAYMARSDANRSLFVYFEPPIRMLDTVKASLEEASRIRPDSAEVYSSLGLTYVMAWDWNKAWSNLSRARDLDPTLALTELGFALYYAGLGEPEKVKKALARATELDPLHTELADWGTWALFMVGEEDAAKAWGEERMAQHPSNGFVFCGSGVSAYIRGDTARSIEIMEKGVELADRAPLALIMLAQAYGYAGQRERVLPLLEEADRANIYACPYESAVAYLTIGDKDRAIELLHESVAARSNCLMFLRSDPRMKVLRDDPRYADRYAQLLALVGLDDKSLASYRR
jgi:DNA-binding winged helix-turn-helix (wHTH) protein/TolB-like protein/Tfp pilus assembly protein PilF